MALALEERDSSLKRRYQALENLYDKTKDEQQAKRSKTRLLDVCLTPLQKKLIAPMLL